MRLGMRVLKRWWRAHVGTRAPRGSHGLAGCDDCPLASCDAGRCAIIVSVRCPALDADRLRTLGVYEGARVNVVDCRGGVLLDVCGTRLALNDATAAAILVRRVAA